MFVRAGCGSDGNGDELFSFAEQLAAEHGSDVTTILSGSKEAMGRCCLHFAANFGHGDLCSAIVSRGVRCVVCVCARGSFVCMGTCRPLP